MTKIIPFLIVAAIIFPFSPYEDTHWPKWMMFHFVAAVILGIHYGVKYVWPVGLGMFVSIFSAAQIICNRDTFKEMNLILRIDMSNMVGKAVTAFLLMIMLAELFDLKMLRDMLKAYFILCVFHCVYVLIQLYYFGIVRDRATGFLPNVSMGPSMLAVLYPLLYTMNDGNKFYQWVRRAGLILFPILIVREGSSIAWAAFMVGVGVFFFESTKVFFGKRQAITTAIFFIVVCAVVGPMIDANFFRFERVSRFTFWPFIFEQWRTKYSLLIGAGTGAFRHLGPNMQQQINFEVGQWWYWAHNDWLQIIFETGILGFISAAGIWIHGVIRAHRFMNYGLVASLFALAVVGFGNYFLRLAEFCFLVMILLAIPLKYYGEHGNNQRMVSGD